MTRVVPPVRHRRSVADGVVSHYAVVGEGAPLLLLHGFPQTWREWEGVIRELAAEFMVIAPDLRGIGGVPGPANGYDVFTLAGDVRAIVDNEVGDAPMNVCGHDMGSYVALAYALIHREHVTSLVLVDAPLLGTALGDSLWSNPRTWHIAFHANVDVAHMLIAGRERAYVEHFIRSRLIAPDAISAETMDHYVRAYSAPGALRSALETDREIPRGSELVRAELAERGRLTCPVTYVAGALTAVHADLQTMLDELALSGRVRVVANSGHFVPDEQPAALARIIRETAAERTPSATTKEQLHEPS